MMTKVNEYTRKNYAGEKLTLRRNRSRHTFRSDTLCDLYVCLVNLEKFPLRSVSTNIRIMLVSISEEIRVKMRCLDLYPEKVPLRSISRNIIIITLSTNCLQGESNEPYSS